MSDTIKPNAPGAISSKTLLRRELRARLEAMTDDTRHRHSAAATALLAGAVEFQSAQVVMIFLSTLTEIDTTAIALKCWQAGKTVVAPKVSWDQRRMLPVEITSLHQASFTTTGPGVREPLDGQPVPLDMIDLVLVPGMGFTDAGFRIGRGMGFYDRFLALPEFHGVSCGLAFEEQIVADLPVLDHDMPLGMLVTNQKIRRFVVVK